MDKVSTTYGMEISAEKTKLMTNNIKGISLDVRIGGQKLEIVQSFKYLGSVVSDEGSKQEILSRIAQTTGALTKLKTIWKDKNIALSSKIKPTGALTKLKTRWKDKNIALSSKIKPTGALTKLKTRWKDKSIALSSKIRLMRSLVISIFLYTCETWTHTAELERKIQPTGMRCFRRLLGVSYRDHVTNEEVRNRIRQCIGPYDDLLTTEKNTN